MLCMVMENSESSLVPTSRFVFPAFSFKMEPICHSYTLGMIQRYDRNPEDGVLREMSPG